MNETLAKHEVAELRSLIISRGSRQEVPMFDSLVASAVGGRDE